ncbi:TadE/TadG family type IV pilus assembly protein [Microvirga terricola]|uniref:Pilus assembly protein n=1 Tax=Microvirga terricola TaxID=2719797 RepID=A0ABX0VGI3_9HYPH|nr:TadE/TadG family type IV pilus assembly protein [Microvirga terricola]NIX78379.1 pilus assembly protein [Microvirga terricola]
MREGWAKKVRDDERGATAIEFALVAPAFLALILGIFQLSLLGLTVASLNYSVEKAARCDAISTKCPDVTTYYFAPAPIPVFTHDKAAVCGASVSATVTYQLNVLIYQASIPLSASACFP